jgi:hypothetical protein
MILPVVDALDATTTAQPALWPLDLAATTGSSPNHACRNSTLQTAFAGADTSARFTVTLSLAPQNHRKSGRRSLQQSPAPCRQMSAAPAGALAQALSSAPRSFTDDLAPYVNTRRTPDGRCDSVQLPKPLTERPARRPHSRTRAHHAHTLELLVGTTICLTGCG